MSEEFKRTIENFTCENCNESVDGNGYTNHCPHCLWSKHVDENPGDRAMKDVCGGLMEPIGTEEKGGEWRVIQKCQKCGRVHKNRLSLLDNFDHLIKITKNNSSK